MRNGEPDRRRRSPARIVADLWAAPASLAALPPALASYLLSSKDSPEKWAALLKRQMAKPTSKVVWPASLDEASGGVALRFARVVRYRTDKVRPLQADIIQ